MYPVKQSTALTIPVFAHDANGDAVTGLVDGGFTKRISKNGGAFGAMTVTITEMENGFYSLPLGTGHTDTTGVLTIILTHGSAKQINIQVRVFAKLIDDLNDVAATDIVSAGAITTSGGAVSTVSTLTGHTPQTGDSFARLGAPAGASVSADILAIDNFVDGLETTIGVAGAGLTDITINDASVDAILDETLTAHVTADSLGVAVKDILSDTNELQTDDYPTSIAAIQSDTDDIQTRLPAALVSGKMDSDAVAVGGSTDGANRLSKATQCNVFCTVGAASTTTSIVTSAMDPSAAATDQFKGKIVTFDANTTTANLRGQSTDITASTAGGVLTVTALTDAPVSGDIFVIT